MKKVFSSNSQLAHAWANQLQPEGRASNMFFKGPVIYSYGHHYEIARFVDAPNGQKVCFVNSNGYSHSTAKHTSHIRNAIPANIASFEVPFINGNSFNVGNLFAIISVMTDECKKHIQKQLTARTDNGHFNRAARLFWKIEQICNVFELPQPIRPDNWDEARTKSENLENTRNERVEAQKQKELKKSFELLTKWLNHEYNGQLYNLPVHLRVSKDGKLIETTKGARVEMSEALQLLKKLRGSENVKGDQIGGFTVIDNNEQAVKIGCHVIGWDVINNFFK